MIQFACPGCGRNLKILSARAGEAITCPFCQKSCIAPAESAQPSATARAGYKPTRPAAGAYGKAALGDVASEAKGDFRPCPFCAEPIRSAAIKCRHCGEFLAGAPGWRKGFNYFSYASGLIGLSGALMISMLVGLLTFNIGLALRVGMWISILGMVAGLAGIGWSFYRRRSGGLWSGLSGAVFGLIGIILFSIALSRTAALSSQLYGISPALGGMLDPSGNAKVAMACDRCGHTAEVSAGRAAAQQMRAVAGIFRDLSAGGDIQGILDRAQRVSEQGMRCPECGNDSFREAIRCGRCGELFAPRWSASDTGEHLEAVCPHCGEINRGTRPGMDLIERMLEGDATVH